MPILLRPVFSLLVFAGLSWSLTSQTPAPELPTFFSSLSEDELPSVVIETDLRRLIGRKTQEEYQDAQFSLSVRDSLQFSGEIRLKARGNNRKQACFYPPLKLKFDKKDLQKAGLQPSNKIKLVVQCRSSDMNGQLILKEYLLYKLYNLLTPYSYRVQLLQFTYLNNRKKGKKNSESEPQYGFLIEPEEEWERRHEGRILDRERGKVEYFEPAPLLAMSVFQYMAGNTDWYIYNLHNLQMAKVPEFDKLIPLPYDFDYAGLVDSYYAIPHESLPIKDVRDRYYVGETCTPAELDEVRGLFIEKKAEVLATVACITYLKESEKKGMINYLEDFYEILENPKRAEAIFCK